MMYNCHLRMRGQFVLKQILLGIDISKVIRYSYSTKIVLSFFIYLQYFPTKKLTSQTLLQA